MTSWITTIPIDFWITTLPAWLGLVFGAIPAIVNHVKKWREPKPDLKVENVTLAIKDRGYGTLKLKLKNHGNVMATNVRCLWTLHQKSTDL